jgi:hypothetical protein
MLQKLRILWSNLWGFESPLEHHYINQGFQRLRLYQKINRYASLVCQFANRVGIPLPRRLVMHAIAAPEGTGGKPALFGELLHHFQRHCRRCRPTCFIAIGSRCQINGCPTGMERWETPASHVPVIVNPGILFQHPGVWPLGNGCQNPFQ